MARWKDVAAAAPDFAAAVQAFLEARTHKTLATLRRDGAPRISGTEASLLDGDLWLGSMWRSVKALDLLRDPRFALHSGSVDPPDWKGDAKVSGRMEEITDQPTFERVMRALTGEAPSGRSHLFRAEIEQVALVRLGEPADHLVIEPWSEGGGLKRTRR